MKKIALMALGLTGVLASCGGGTSTIEGAPTTNWQLRSDVKDINNNIILKAGTYVICNDRPTTVQANVSWGAGVTQVQLWARGQKESKPVAYYNVNPTGGTGTATFTLNGGVAPQSITVNPITTPVRVKSYVELGTATGVSDIKWNSYDFPVLESCTTA
ncbi:hypothetical protein Deipr_0921 [Deinococcus proteolyticus MRP]|uniref:Lipoprotein n=1 Tax=Deinococcus proteolyticus (strain ATCC 35074 / DSM 20540 / JCM 6276 / NBRC 101906 / NCIMB 13154 / VKM Ac-1939 / CCM 2703 / MRP) TaxID=693977 RepID=F0RMM7_DEIPM|nr:hypothetical protein [Deinococcus proteolyticus]ADY26077.1 hypothetical protein Deipr_0921 [Deinococcus proteolyticus MRP]